MAQPRASHFPFLLLPDFSLHPRTEGRDLCHTMFDENTTAHMPVPGIFPLTSLERHIVTMACRAELVPPGNPSVLQSQDQSPSHPSTTVPLCFFNQASACQQLNKLQTSDHLFQHFDHHLTLTLQFLRTKIDNKDGDRVIPI